MTAEAIKLCNPTTIHSRSTECHNQDKVSIGTIAARDARSIVELTQNIAAIHLMACCQALELRGIERAARRRSRPSGSSVSLLLFMDRDRYPDVDIAATVGLIQSGVLAQTAALTQLREPLVGRAGKDPGVSGSRSVTFNFRLRERSMTRTVKAKVAHRWPGADGRRRASSSPPAAAAARARTHPRRRHRRCPAVELDQYGKGTGAGTYLTGASGRAVYLWACRHL